MWVVVALIGAVFWIAAGYALANMLKSERSGRDLGETLLAAVQGLRLHDMIKRRGHDPERFVQTTPVVTLRGQIRNCRGCDAHHDCDGFLGGETDAKAETFCPNAPTLPAAAD